MSRQDTLYLGELSPPQLSPFEIPTVLRPMDTNLTRRDWGNSNVQENFS